MLVVCEGLELIIVLDKFWKLGFSFIIFILFMLIVERLEFEVIVLFVVVVWGIVVMVVFFDSEFFVCNFCCSICIVLILIKDFLELFDCWLEFFVVFEVWNDLSCEGFWIFWVVCGIELFCVELVFGLGLVCSEFVFIFGVKGGLIFCILVYFWRSFLFLLVKSWFGFCFVGINKYYYEERIKEI